MAQDIKSVMLKAQQGEIDAALMYRTFASITKDEKLKAIFSEAAADEGRHANVLSKITNKKLKPNLKQAKLLGIVYRIMPKKIMFRVIHKGEYAGGDSYKPYIKDYPQLEQLMNDEYRHGDTFLNLTK